MRFERFSAKQLKVLGWWMDGSPYAGRDGIICDGAVRSGKTLCMTISFIGWAMYRYEGRSFAICGKTVTSLTRNIVHPLLPVLAELGFGCVYKPSKGCIDVTYAGRRNRFWLFGGRDEGSSALIQGVTLAGVLLDEAALMPRSFVEQALARCSVAGSRFWFNCNPEHPLHWFYSEWIRKAEEKNCVMFHFTMEDNPSLTPEIRRRYESLYSGVFYDRFVRGLWTAPAGLVYPMFSEERCCAEPPEEPREWSISCDYGTVNPCSMGLWGRCRDGVWYRTAEFYHDSRKAGRQLTDEEYRDAMERLADGREVSAVVVDPSAASFMECLRRRGLWRVLPAANAVADGIRLVSDALLSGGIAISAGCRDSIREFGLYRWQENSGRDAPVKENDHAMDDIRYFVSTILARPAEGFCAVSVPREERARPSQTAGVFTYPAKGG